MTGLTAAVIGLLATASITCGVLIAGVFAMHARVVWPDDRAKSVAWFLAAVLCFSSIAMPIFGAGFLAQVWP